jgi:hypothetical protein
MLGFLVSVCPYPSIVSRRARATASIFHKLGLQPSDDDNRRVRAVLAYLNG